MARPAVENFPQLLVLGPSSLQGRGHEYKRDPRRPEWRGWHAARRGLGTTLRAAGEADQTIQAILRHANVKTTQACYIKAVPRNSRTAMQKLGQSIAEKMWLRAQLKPQPCDLSIS
jgi:integrase